MASKAAASLLNLPALIVPGIGNSGPQHWQTLWEHRHPHWRRVPQRDWEHPVCDEWVHALDAAIVETPSPPVLIAHSIGVLVVVHWASRCTARVLAALLVAVPDPQGSNFPAAAQGFHPVPMAPLSFPTLIVASGNDSFGSVAHARHCAVAWGSEFVDIGSAGHINADSGHGEWTEGVAFLQSLIERTLPPSR